MNAFNHYATMMVTCLTVGYLIPKLGLDPMDAFMLSALVGICLGLVWSRITGYNRNKKEGKNEQQ